MPETLTVSMPIYIYMFWLQQLYCEYLFRVITNDKEFLEVYHGSFEGAP